MVLADGINVVIVPPDLTVVAHRIDEIVTIAARKPDQRYLEM
jgi:hypothetical protein